MIGNMTDKAGLALNAIDVSMTYGNSCNYYEYENAQNLYEDAVATDAILSNIRTILGTAKSVLGNIDSKNVEACNGAMLAALSSIYNILLTPDGEPK